jgi:hypothetical protein
MQENLFLKNLPADFVFPAEPAGLTLLREYGAVFVARGGAVTPKTVFFRNQKEVEKFQTAVATAREKIGEHTFELQRPAMTALRSAIREAAGKKLSITGRNADSAKRDYAGTIANWKSRVDPGLDFWVARGRLDPAEAARLRRLSPVEQVEEIFRLEAEGMFFAKSKDKPIIFSVAPPGASQHISMLALDVGEFENAAVREILARHGWFQTVVSDLPHFTYLGVPENDLPGLGLKKLTQGVRRFWVPDLR